MFDISGFFYLPLYFIVLLVLLVLFVFPFDELILADRLSQYYHMSRAALIGG